MWNYSHYRCLDAKGVRDTMVRERRDGWQFVSVCKIEDGFLLLMKKRKLEL